MERTAQRKFPDTTPTRRNVGRSPPFIPASGSTCGFTNKSIDFTDRYTTILMYSCMRPYPCRVKSYSLKILPINPYNSKILVSSCLQLHCFHRPEGEGVPAVDFGRDPKST